MTELCSTCLSSNRRLTPISSVWKVLAFIKWTDVKWNMRDDKVCWECLALLRRVESFKRQVLLAQLQLRAYKYNDMLEVSLKSMSTLSTCIVDMSGDVKPLPLLTSIKIEIEECDSYNNSEIPPLKIENNEINDHILFEHNKTNFIKQEVNNSYQIEPTYSSSNELANVDKEEHNKSILIEIEGYHSNQIKEHINLTNNESDNSDEEEKDCISNKTTNEIFTVVRMTIGEMLEARDLDKERPMYKKSPYKCVTCLKGFFTEDKLKIHNSSMHDEKMGPYKCPICEERFNQVDKHNLHHDSHFRQYQCRECEFRHHRLVEIQKHVKTIHKLKNYDCGFCDKSFMTRGQRDYHRSACHKEKPTCNICGKTCKTNSDLKRHMAKHVGPTEQCPQCGKHYKNLKQHLRTHVQPDARRDEAFCAECNVQYRSLYIYRRHLKNHSRHRDPNRCNYKCDRCDGNFLNKCDLYRHKLMHDKQFQFYCDYCSKGYYKKCVLERHISDRHLGIPRPKDKICTVCGKGFTDKQVLKRHFLIHTGEKPHKCELCPWRFTQHNALVTHMRGKHPEASVVKKKDKTVGKKDKTVKKKEE